MPLSRGLRPLLFWALFLINPLFASSESEEPLWELGLAAAVVSTPHYVGSDETYALPLAVPYFIYRGEVFKADREGIRGELVRRHQFTFDLGFSFDLPVSEENQARQGMPELQLTGQVGPRLNWRLCCDRRDAEITVRLPLRYVMDIDQTSLGWVAEPVIELKQERLWNNESVDLLMTTGFLYAGEEYNHYYYGVPDELVRPERPSYSPASGLHSWSVRSALTVAISPDVSVGAFLRYKNLSGSVIRNSPLVRRHYSITTGLGFIWRLSSSIKPAKS